MNSTSLLLKAALDYAARGWKVIPLHTPVEGGCSCRLGAKCKDPGKHPRISRWPETATDDPDQIREWWRMWPDSNVGILAGKRSKFWALDIDPPKGFETLQKGETRHGPLPETPTQITGRGGQHRLFKYVEGIGNKVGFAEGLDTRSDGGLIVVEPSVHPNGKEYMWHPSLHPDDVFLADAPDWLIRAINKAGAKAEKTGTAAPLEEKLREGARNDRLASLAGTMRRRGLSAEEMLPSLASVNTKRFDPPLDDDEVWKIASGMERYAPAINGTNGARAEEPFVVNVVSVVAESALPEPPDELEPEALYGLAGEVVLTIEPHTESHPAGLLASFLIGAGCLIGPGPHVFRDGRPHPGNEFGCLVGPTGGGGKGTASAQVERMLRACMVNLLQKDDVLTMHDVYARETPYDHLLLGGLGSGEALIEALADPDEPDKRKLVFEEEFSKPLAVMRREGSTLSQNLRSAWDGGALANRTKGKRLVARGGHVCVLAHITREELDKFLTSTEVFNGFANRFLWFWTRRVKDLPFGGGRPPLGPLVSTFHHMLEYSKQLGEMDFDEEVKRLWDQGGIYRLLRNRSDDFFGAITSRAATHVTRLSLLYAVLDGQSAIRMPHMLAALAVWDYSERTCRYLFGQSCGDDYADSILEILHEVYPGALTRTELRDRFGRNAPAGRIPKALTLLEREGKAERVVVATEGRPAEYWRATTASGNDQNDINDKSPLRRAREWLREREG